jgi:copper ion binding protein
MQMEQTHEVDLKVLDISCEHCVNTISQALGKLTGVERVSVDIPTKTVQVAFDPGEVTLDRITATLDDAGYAVSNVGGIHPAQ